MEQILLRSRQIRKKRERTRTRLIAGISCTLTLLLVFLIAVAPQTPSGSAQPSTMGAFLLSPDKGVYVFIAVLAFTLGILVTLLCIRRRTGRSPEEDPEPDGCCDAELTIPTEQEEN